MQPTLAAADVHHEQNQLLGQQTIETYPVTESTWGFPLPPNPFQYCGNVQYRFLGRLHCLGGHRHDGLRQVCESDDTYEEEAGDVLARQNASTGLLPTVPRLSCRVLRPLGHGGSSREFLRTVAQIHIRHVEVGDGSARSFIVETYRFQRGSLNRRIESQVVACASTAAGMRVVRRFSQFVALRKTIARLTCLNARFVCPMCHEFEKIVAYHPAQPWMLACLATRSGLRKRILESFLTTVVKVARSTEIEHKRDCRLCWMLPQMLRSFLSDA